MTRLIIILCMIGFLAGCGQKGDLYMPEEAPQQLKDKKPKKDKSNQ